MDSILTFIGLMKRAGALAIGAEHASDYAQQGKARLFCIASDAAENTRRAITYAAQQRNTPIADLRFTKLELGAALGQKECAALAVTDAGFARALAQKLGLEVNIKLPRPKIKPKAGQGKAARPDKAANAKAAVRRRQTSAPARKKPSGSARLGSTQRMEREAIPQKRTRHAKGLNKGDRV